MSSFLSCLFHFLWKEGTKERKEKSFLFNYTRTLSIDMYLASHSAVYLDRSREQSGSGVKVDRVVLPFFCDAKLVLPLASSQFALAKLVGLEYGIGCWDRDGK